MKLTVFQFEGTPQELDASEALRALTGHGAAHVLAFSAPGASSANATLGNVPGVPEEGQETVRRLLGRGPAPELFVAFLREVVEWPKVGVHGIKRKKAIVGEPLDYNQYLRLRKQGSLLGGFAYIYAERSSINLRLSHTEQELQAMGVGSARVLTTGPHEYRVSVDLTDQASLDDALRLARIAYDAT
ncbi:hypothetical protein TPA0598_13_00020 [Streptomyces lydicamycinicus]|uniref:DUF5655 domain-containing protein n=1 Tax=Streptomyces lydicamycinicus TaxID=1546107 RepID=A0A0P4RGD7_9ACTN|nr:hypothetical protein [Streptomyces lydicamycinicus]GAO12818.1 hypothetical protein TPA0598_13_00020 [Streptomyces lydicamycinicus]